MPDKDNAEAPAPILQRLLEMESRLHKRMPDALTEEKDEAAARAIHDYTMLVARIAWEDGFLTARDYRIGGPTALCEVEEDARARFPLPPRKVLREERVRDEDGMPAEPFLYRVNVPGSGEVEWCDPREDTMDTHRYVWRGLYLSAAPAPNAARIRLWADLLANPYREGPQ